MTMKTETLFLALTAIIVGLGASAGATAKTLNACDIRDPKIDSWKRVDVRSGLTVQLPASFAEDTPINAKDGDRAWLSGDVAFAVGHGSWKSSWLVKKGKYWGGFTSDTLSECESKVDGRQVHIATTLSRGRYGVTAWFRDYPNAQDNIVLGGEGLNIEDQRLLLAILRTARTAGETQSGPPVDRPAGH